MSPVAGTVSEQLQRVRLEVGRYVFDALAAGPEDGETVLLLHGFPEFADCWRSS